MAIKKVADGTYTVSFGKRHPETRVPITLRRKGIKTKTDAQRTYNELVIEVDLKIKRQKIPTWSKLVDEYLKNIAVGELTNGTIYGREKLLNAHTIHLWGDRFVDAITKGDIHAALHGQMGKYSESHRKNFLKCVRGVFHFAVDRGYINRDPTPLLKFKVSEKIRAVLNEEEIKFLLRRAQEISWDWYPHYAVAIYTGMRNGEMYALTWDKVDFDERKIKVDCSWSSKNGLKSTKSGHDRVLEIPEPLLPVLRELKLNAGGDGYVLPRLADWDRGDQAKVLRGFLKMNGLTQIRFHDLRASWATLLLGKGAIPSKVMSMGGWKDMDTMMIYMRKAGIDIRGATSCLDGMNTHGVKSAEVVNLRPL